MKIIEAIILGIVQGFTEFIPVSSSGHLVLLSRVFNIGSNGITFEVILHTATLLSVIVIFRHDLYKMIRKPFSRINLLIVAASIPTMIIYLMFKDFFLKMFETGIYLGYSFILTGIILFLSDTKKACKTVKDDIDKISFVDAVFIGTVQGVALIPGISRSGTTLAAGLFRRIDISSALRFSFLLSIPAVLGAILTDTIDIAKGDVVFDLEILPLLLGFAAAFVCGYLAIRYMIRLVAKRGIRPFAYYLWILGSLVLLDQYVFKIFL